MVRKIVRSQVIPEGLSYFPEIISENLEQQLLAIFEGLMFEDFVMHGVAAKRKVCRYGFGYEFYSPHVDEVEPFPDWLIELRNRAALAAELQPGVFEQASINWYPPGAGIGWHRDAPAFGATVLGISLASETEMRFRRSFPDHFEMYKLPLAPRSLYALGGSSRSVWQHSIAPVQKMRYSVTFRIVRDKYRRLKELPTEH